MMNKEYIVHVQCTVRTCTWPPNIFLPDTPLLEMILSLLFLRVLEARRGSSDYEHG